MVTAKGVLKNVVVKVEIVFYFFFFFNDTATTEIYTLSLHDALPISLTTKPSNPHLSLRISFKMYLFADAGMPFNSLKEEIGRAHV